MLSSFLVALHLHKCRKLMDDFNVLIAQDEADRRRHQQEQQQQEEEQSEADVETQSIDGEQEEEGEEDEVAAAAETGSTADSEGTLEPPEPPPMPRPSYLRLRPGQGAEGMPRVEIRSRDDLRAWIEIYEDGEDEVEIRAKRRRRKRRAGGLRAGAELDCARGAFEYVLTCMGPALFREFMELMG